ncbi:MAG TPA: prolyl oligopeptidase family serine peptidase, partial [Acidimicrobiia bacterium]|nr:prolyl oligopeptidase family serine peptidase [Acidimicrobiia bacterium]
AWDVEAATMRRLTDQGTATLVVDITPDGSHVLFLQDVTGSELGHLMRVPFEGGEAVDLTPDLPPYAVTALTARDDGFAAVIADDDGRQVMVLDRDGLRTCPVDGLGLSIVAGTHSVAVTEATPGQGLVPRVRLLDRRSLTTTDQLDGAAAFVARGQRFALATAVDGWQRPALWVPGEEVEVLDIPLEGDVVPVDLSPDGWTLLLHQSHRTVDRLHIFDVATGDLTGLALGTGGILGFLAPPSLHGRSATAVWTSATTPATVVDVTASEARPLLPGLAAEFAGARWEEFTFRSTDDAEIHGWVLVPPGDGPFPLILNGHGGPTSVQGPVFAPTAQAWVDHGFAYATVNYRGSVGFGEAFREALTGRIGTVEIDDIVSARRWLVDSGIADPDRVLLNGYSYGGYITCMTMGLHPGLWAGGIAGAPVVDWVMLHEDSPSTRAYADALFGGGPDTAGKRMRKASPTTYVDRVDAPMFISAPTDDGRTPIRPVREYVRLLREAGVDVELHEMRGGHAGAGKDQTIDMVERWLSFAARVVDREH